MSTFSEINKTARAQVGYREGGGKSANNDQKFSKELPGFDWSNKQAWCATFVCWVFWKTGNYDLIDTPSAGVDQLSVGFKRANRWSEYPAKGAVVFYGTKADLNHTGIVVDYDGEFIWAVEGNTNDSGSREGNGVYLKKRPRKGTNIVGYGYPKFKEGIESADPKFGRAPAPAKPKAAPAPAKPAKPQPTVSLKNVIHASKVAGWSYHIVNVTVREDGMIVQNALKAEKVQNYKQFERKVGLPTNGVPDMKSLTALGKRHGFKVVA